MTVSEFAEKVNTYMDATADSFVTIPTDDKLSTDEQDIIGRAVVFGRMAGRSMNNDSLDLADYYRRCFNVLAGRIEKECMTFGQLDMAYQIGYNSVRKE